jgi:hypothetical protein
MAEWEVVFVVLWVAVAVVLCSGGKGKKWEY